MSIFFNTLHGLFQYKNVCKAGQLFGNKKNAYRISKCNISHCSSSGSWFWSLVVVQGRDGGQGDRREGGGDQDGGGRHLAAQGRHLQPQGIRNIHLAAQSRHLQPQGIGNIHLTAQGRHLQPQGIGNIHLTVQGRHLQPQGRSYCIHYWGKWWASTVQYIQNQDRHFVYRAVLLQFYIPQGTGNIIILYTMNNLRVGGIHFSSSGLLSIHKTNKRFWADSGMWVATAYTRSRLTLQSCVFLVAFCWFSFKIRNTE